MVFIKKMATKTRISESTKKQKKREWKSISFQDEDVFNFQQGGLISLEEMTDYQISDYAEFQGQQIGSGGPKKAKVFQTENNDSANGGADSNSQLKKNTKKRKRRKHLRIRKKGLDASTEKLVKGNVMSVSNESKSQRKETVSSSPEELAEIAGAKDAKASLGVKGEGSAAIEMKCNMSEWHGLGVPDKILAAMSEKGFTQPTPIQSETLPWAIFHHQDIIGAAETGSGKTLAFALPILTHIIDYKQKRFEKTRENDGLVDDKEKPLYALILTPTRELAMQIYKNMKDLTKFISVDCAVIVGGLSVQKQERILKKCPEVIIGTPGRLLGLLNDGDTHLNKLNQIKFLVIDEVDRMLEFGHYKEASEILKCLSQSNSKWQTFLFSATLTVPQYHKKWSAKSKAETDQDSVQKLVEKAKLSPKAKIIDLTKKHIAAESIKQWRVICTDEEKDLYLLYLVHCLHGRVLIFVNSINSTRKITNFLNILGKKALQLHAGKQQRQRLKALDRFMAKDDSILVATDVAARGIDVPNVDTIIHYHLPKDPKIYIHRSGRTARAKNVGQSIILEGPKDFKEYRKVYDLMKLDKDIPSLDVDVKLLPDLRKRVKLARKIDQEEHQQRKFSTARKWHLKVAKSLDLESDNECDSNDPSSKKDTRMLQSLKKELDQLLKTPLIPIGFSGTYITKSGQLQTLNF